MKEARSRVELAIIQSDHRAHAATCVPPKAIDRMTWPRPSWRAAAAPRSPRRSDVFRGGVLRTPSAWVIGVHPSWLGLELGRKGHIPRLAFKVQSKMDGKIFDSEGHYVADIRASKIYDLSGKRLYDLRGQKIYKPTGELIGHHS